MTIGIDASNLLEGGGTTHLIELLSNLPQHSQVKNIYIWSNKKTLSRIPIDKSIVLLTHPYLNGGYIKRLFWTFCVLPSEARNLKCDVLYHPGGFGTTFHPYISMCRNMLVFDKKESSRYHWGFDKIRIMFVSMIQKWALKNSDGYIFISNYAQHFVTRSLKLSNAFNSIMINHGVSAKFRNERREYRKQDEFSDLQPVHILYVSTIDVYKHQWNVALAIDALRKKGVPVKITFVGGYVPVALKRFNEVLAEIKESDQFIEYKGLQPYVEIHKCYQSADIFLYASTCENMPNILLEAMSAGLPIACSSSMPMPEFAKDAAIYFEAENVSSITGSLEQLINSYEMRVQLATKARDYALEYSWEKCSQQTFDYITKISKGKRK
jgi:glycosyltransferase involved in cell wall biosynthesis